jgi:hypothetical protein
MRTKGYGGMMALSAIGSELSGKNVVHHFLHIMYLCIFRRGVGHSRNEASVLSELEDPFSHWSYAVSYTIMFKA